MYNIILFSIDFWIPFFLGILFVLMYLGLISPKLWLGLTLISLLLWASWNYSQPMPLQSTATAIQSDIHSTGNSTISIQIEGVKNRGFHHLLSQNLGYTLKQKGKMVIKIDYQGVLSKQNNEVLGRIEFNYEEGSIVISVDNKICIGPGKYVLAATQYRGMTLPKLEEDLEKRKVSLLQKNISEVSQLLKNCIARKTTTPDSSTRIF